MSSSKEVQFQCDIVQAMTAQGWLTGPASGYDRNHALYTQDFLDYFKEAWPKHWEKFAKANPTQAEKVLVQKLVQELEKNGTLHVLRHGFKLPGVEVRACSFRPDHGMNPDSMHRYQCNRLRVVAEVSYSPHAVDAKGAGSNYDPRLDLVLFVNGIPTATLELKSEFKQSVELAKRQYMLDRPVVDPITRKQEPLLTFKRGALVHFAVGQSEVAMTTRLQGKETFFLPFNLGSEDGGAGNPLAKTANEYAVSYLWNEIFQKDHWLKILQRFLHLSKQTNEDTSGKQTVKESMIFPRFHQWDVVHRLIETTRREGAGKRYLIQHSAGSGKSNSIAWTAHQLSSLYDETGENRLFNSVIVITDRTVLDKQLQNTIYQFDHAQGVVLPITRDIGNKSKSEQLADALASNTRIIIVTIQTFPALFDALDKYPKLAQGCYAVIADEAHSSQTGSSASKLKQILASGDSNETSNDVSNSAELPSEPSSVPDTESNIELSPEEILDKAVAARGPTDRISYYAFTATPKSKTLELFGRPANPDLPPSNDNLPGPFHLYSMRQAIEEGFILDVLQNYTTYSTAWKIANAENDTVDEEVDSRKAKKTLAKWVKLHPYNINQKVEVIVEHFRANIRHLLGGQAKAMVVTSSRQEAVRYQLEMSKYIQERGYQDVHPLVAFSGTVLADEYIPQDVTETSSILNPGLKGRDHAKAFDTPDFNVMIAANKYQTGFDQPKLCAMYVDKKLHGVDCVQTLSRLNRTYPGKQTFILDFFNDGQEILDAFLPYYKKAELTGVTDPQLIYDLQGKLDQEGIYHWEEVEAFATAFFDPKGKASALSYHCTPARDRFATRYKEALSNRSEAIESKRVATENGDKYGINVAEGELKQAGELVDQLDLFKKNLQSFVRLYEFLSQIIPYEDRELEQLCVFAKHLYPLLRIDRLDDSKVDVGELKLTHYRLTKHAEQNLKLAEQSGEYQLEPISGVGTGAAHDPEKKRLSEIIQALNDLFGAEVGDEDQIQFLNNVTERISRQEDVMAQVRNHSAEQVMHGLLPKRVIDAVIDLMIDNSNMSEQILESEKKADAFCKLIISKLLKAAV